ncbi:MAG TPA: transglutaminase family protein [Rhodopila sp.]|uniref:transglutaminase family protein n=1 Tax=Rhodopila sp. TaxID=2480087 RepID=UPI002CEAFEA3|nr:transglutaminase family protein [Rhodopila sp.]HVY15166.1 transglutaminase family protein [Rhodopila sp.]
MRYRLRHVTRYAYGNPVELAAHMAHMRPRPMPFQTVLSDAVDTTPTTARRRDGHDHFGNRVTWLFLDLPHADFELTAESLVEVAYPDPPAPDSTPPWEHVAEAARQPEHWQAVEFRFPTHLAPVNAETRAYAESSFTPGRPVLAALLDLNSRIFHDFRFRPGVTTVSTPVSQVIQKREGVCQDFTHVMVSALRGLGLPARYTSGYIRTRPPPGQAKRQGADQSHAWVGAWIGPEHGWIDVDPTNGIVVKEEHVLLGWGRDFNDISPLRGVILGGGRHNVTVSVDLEPAVEGDPV